MKIVSAIKCDPPSCLRTSQRKRKCTNKVRNYFNNNIKGINTLGTPDGTNNEKKCIYVNINLKTQNLN